MLKKEVKGPSNDIKWFKDDSFYFIKGSRPLWTNDAKNIKVAKNQDRRHGLH